MTDDLNTTPVAPVPTDAPDPSPETSPDVPFQAPDVEGASVDKTDKLEDSGELKDLVDGNEEDKGGVATG
jgi:hypothetical protein